MVKAVDKDKRTKYLHKKQQQKEKEEESKCGVMELLSAFLLKHPLGRFTDFRNAPPLGILWPPFRRNLDVGFLWSVCPSHTLNECRAQWRGGVSGSLLSAEALAGGHWVTPVCPTQWEAPTLLPFLMEKTCGLVGGLPSVLEPFPAGQPLLSRSLIPRPPPPASSPVG